MSNNRFKMTAAPRGNDDLCFFLETVPGNLRSQEEPIRRPRPVRRPVRREVK